MILVTGGAGFIGANFVQQWISEEKTGVVNLDKLTCAGNLNNLSNLEYNPLHHFIRGDIRNRPLLQDILHKYAPTAIVHFAAETTTNRMGSQPESTVHTNIGGTFDLLETALAYWKQLEEPKQKKFRFVHLSSDEVYGTAPPDAPRVKESAQLRPDRLYAASKASAEHLVQTYHIHHSLPTLIIRSPNTFGPFQFPEKFVPITVVNALQGLPLPVFGDGTTRRTWLFVHDLCSAIRMILHRGVPGEIYNISEQANLANKELVEQVCEILDGLQSDSRHKPHAKLIKFVKERAGQDTRYLLDSSKLKDLGWQPERSFHDRLIFTINWYLCNMPWVENVVSGEYRDWIQADYGTPAAK